MRSFAVTYRFGGRTKHAPLPEWLADSLDDRFEGDLGLIQTTRLPVHQTKVRLLAAAIDAVEQAEARKIGLDEVDVALVERGLLLCVERHGQVWNDLDLGEPPSFAHAFELYAKDAREPAFMQCPEPRRRDEKDNDKPLEPKDVDVGLKLLPQHGYAVPTQVPAADDVDLAFQLMAFAGKLAYTQGWASSSRPLSQGISLDLPGQPSWRFRHEVKTTLEWRKFWHEAHLNGPVVFSWLLEYLPNSETIPRELQHSLLIDVAMPIRVQYDRSIAVYSVTMPVGKTFENRSTAALGPRGAHLAGGLSALPISAVKGWELIQKPFGELNRLDEVLELIDVAHPAREKNKRIGCPTLNFLVSDSDSQLPDGIELVIEGEPTSQSKTVTWHDRRIPMPKPTAGGYGRARIWELWIDCCKSQLEAANKQRSLLYARLSDAFCRRVHNCRSEVVKGKARQKSNRFAELYLRSFDRKRDAQFWTIAARTYNDLGQNRARWTAVLDDAAHEAAQQAFDALGGFDDPATLMAAARSGLLQFIDRREAA